VPFRLHHAADVHPTTTATRGAEEGDVQRAGRGPTAVRPDAFQAKGPNDIIRVSLLDPSGRSSPTAVRRVARRRRTTPTFDVRNPVAGKWQPSCTRSRGRPATTRTGHLPHRRAEGDSVGRVSPATFHTLAPRQSKNVTVSFRLPADSGDTDYAVTFASSTATRRSLGDPARLIDTRLPRGAYSGVITGRNARAVAPAQTFQLRRSTSRGTSGIWTCR